MRGYNLILHTAPFDIGGCDHYHWYLEILPRQVRPAGFEWGKRYGAQSGTA